MSIQEELHNKHKYSSKYEMNFVLSHNDTMACFLGQTAYLTDTNYNPIYEYHSTSYINAVSVSDSSKYMIIQTAHNEKHDEDDGATIIIDLRFNIVIHKSKDVNIRSDLIYIDENKKCFYLYYGNEKLCYNFHCDTVLSPGEKIAYTYYGIAMKSEKPNPYDLERVALKLIEECGEEYNHEDEKILIDILDYVQGKLYPHRLSSLFMKVGDVYYKMFINGADQIKKDNARMKAKFLYEQGLEIYPSLPVKKKLKELNKTAL